VRADNVRNLTNAGWQRAWEYGIRTVLDLRAASETVSDPPTHPDYAHGTVSLFDHFDGDPTSRIDLAARLSGRDIAEQYRTLYLEALELDAPRFAEALRIIANAPPGGVLIHCAHGKDRTGLLAALLLRLVNVPPDLVHADYVRSAARLGLADSAPSGVVDHVVAAVEGERGSIAQYLLGAGATPVELERVKARLLGDRPQSG
jgi:protein tyrosine/serine phosphatase